MGPNSTQVMVEYFYKKNSPKADEFLLEGTPKGGTPWPTSSAFGLFFLLKYSKVDDCISFRAYVSICR